MATNFYVNEKLVSVDEEVRLINFLRFQLHLTSVKDGCSEGACGSCTILIDGVPTKACSLVTTEIQGKHITTVEGLSDFEKEVYTYSFGEAGAVQCGFCIPGMVICAKSLLDKNLNPTEKEIRHAIRNNICRCTGYVKIVKAIEIAAKVFRGEETFTDDKDWKIGKRVPRVDVKDKVTGTAIYPDDIYVKDQLNVIALRSKYPRARILEIDFSEALNVKGVFGIYTAKDIPGDHYVGHLKRDWPAMIDIGETTRFVGDVIALVVADSRQNAELAKNLIKVKYEVLPFVSSPYEAMKEDAPLVHPSGNLLGEIHVDRGNAEKAIKNSDFVVSGTFETPRTEHAFLEPECAIAFPLDDGGVKIYSTDQGVYDTRRETYPMLNLPEEKVLVENCYVGGGFGGKEDVTVQHLSALSAILTKRPCKMKLSRQESLMVHPKRHPMTIEMTIGCNKDGIIQGMIAKVISDTGAYASLGVPVLQRACTHASGPYNYQNFKIDGYAYYTNNPPAGAFRGFGVTQTCFAVETLINRLADKVGLDHWKMRYINAIRPGQSLPNGQIVDNSTGLIETLESVKEEFYSNKHSGIACAMKNAGVGVGLPDYGRVKLEVKDGKVVIHCGGSCIGQGLCTVLKQIVCDTCNLSSDDVVEEKANTQNAPDSGTTSGSRHTTVTGEAARRASVMLKEALDGKSLKELQGQEFYATYLAKTDPMGSDILNPKSHVAYGYATDICVVDEKTHKILSITASHDVGKAINPTSVEGQIEGGVVMGMGFAVRENYLVENCIPKSKFGSLGLFRSDELPEIKSIIIEKEGLETSNGAIGIGEITSIPVAPAIADAYYSLDKEERNSLPLSNTPYIIKTSEVKVKNKRLVLNKDARCIGCNECMHTCAKTFHKTEESRYAFLQVRVKTGVGNQSGLEGVKITRPVVCVQCGTCAKACPVGAISQNRFGVWSVDRKMCIGCGKCREACPLGLIVTEKDNTSTKCIVCGACVRACPTGVLEIGTPEND